MVFGPWRRDGGGSRASSLAAAPDEMRRRGRSTRKGTLKTPVPTASAPSPNEPRVERGRKILSATIAVALLGSAVRIAYSFPAHKFVPDADSLNMGCRALAIRGGHFVVFFSGVQIGALEAYCHAVIFGLLGATRAAISVTPVLAGCATLIVFFLFVQELFSTRVAFFSLLFLALPSREYMAWTYMPNSYPETVLFCVTTLWLAARVARRGTHGLWPLALGLSVGLGWWNSLITLGCSAPALAWLLLFRRRGVSRTRLLGGLLAGFALGASPWIYYNLQSRTATLSTNFASAANGLSALATSRRFATETLPHLLVGLNPFGSPRPMTAVEIALRTPTILVELLALLFLPAAPLLSGREVDGRGVLLLVLVGSTVTALFVFSAPGQVPGPTVRYILPLFFVVAVSLGVTVTLLLDRLPWAAMGIVGVILLFNVSGYYWPGTPERKEWAEKAQIDRRLIRFLEASRIQWICGDYWVVYPVNFLSGLRIRAVPYQDGFDFYRYGEALPRFPARFAVLASTSGELKEWTARTHLTGRVVSPAAGYFVFLPEAIPPASPAALLARLRASKP